MDVLLREPVLLVSLGYIAISAVGLWSSWWFYRRLGVSILDYMQGGDYLVAGLREPVYALVLLLALGWSWLVTWPERWRRRHPERVAALAGRWWTPLVFPERASIWNMRSMQPDTAIVFGVLLAMVTGTTAFSIEKADRVRKGVGTAVEVTLTGSPRPLPGRALLLGTTSGFAFVYWPADARVDAFGLTGVARSRLLTDAKGRPLPGR